MYIQGIDNVYDLEWTRGITYGDVHHQGEVEWSVYNFETPTSPSSGVASTCTKLRESGRQKRARASDL